MNKLLNHLVRNLEIGYKHHPRSIILGCIILFYSLILIQSYFALPRSFVNVFSDTWELLFFFIPIVFVILRLKVRNLLVLGIVYLVLGLSLAFFRFPNFINIEYATVSSITGIWFLGEWFNYRTFKKSLLSELLGGNYYLAVDLFLSTIVLGSIVEFLNAPVGLWWYRWPFPSIEIFGVPVFLVAFGWFPWIFAMFVFLYPFALKRSKKF